MPILRKPVSSEEEEVEEEETDEEDDSTDDDPSESLFASLLSLSFWILSLVLSFVVQAPRLLFLLQIRVLTARFSFVSLLLLLEPLPLHLLNYIPCHHPSSSAFHLNLNHFYSLNIFHRHRNLFDPEIK